MIVDDVKYEASQNRSTIVSMANISVNAELLCDSSLLFLQSRILEAKPFLNESSVYPRVQSSC